MQQVNYMNAGRISYADAWALQEQVFAGVVENKMRNRDLPDAEKKASEHYLILCEHDPVITLGRNADNSNVLINDMLLKQQGIEKFNINRGGDVTFHGPGQIVGYPILDLDHFFTDIGKYLRCLEEVIILTLADYGVKGERLPGVTGVWLDAGLPHKARKICAIGIRCSRWVTMHGFAFNVNTEMDYFKFIIPCGLGDKQVTSLQKETGNLIDTEEVQKKVLHYFEQVFNCSIREYNFMKILNGTV